jgi:hypothetical protein
MPSKGKYRIYLCTAFQQKGRNVIQCCGCHDAKGELQSTTNSLRIVREVVLYYVHLTRAVLQTYTASMYTTPKTTYTADIWEGHAAPSVTKGN